LSSRRDETTRTLAGASRYSRETRVYPSPCAHGVTFVETLKRESVRRRIDVVPPMSDLTTRLLLEHREEFGDVWIPCPPLEAFDAVTDKS
jgi:hypothetical protein